MNTEELRFLRVYRRTQDAGEAFLASGMAAPEKWAGMPPEKCGKRVLGRLRRQMRELDGREEKLYPMSAEKVREEIARIAFDDIGRYLTFYEGEKGFEVHIKPSAMLDTRTISEISVGTGGKVSLKLYSKERALFKLHEILSGKEEDGENSVDLLEMLRSPAAEDGECSEDV